MKEANTMTEKFGTAPHIIWCKKLRLALNRLFHKYFVIGMYFWLIGAVANVNRLMNVITESGDIHDIQAKNIYHNEVDNGTTRTWGGQYNGKLPRITGAKVVLNKTKEVLDEAMVSHCYPEGLE